MRISDWSSDVCSSDLRIVVSSGQIEVASAVSSNPVMLMSPGTSSPLRCATETVAAAMSSLPAKIAVGRRGRVISRWAATSPDSSPEERRAGQECGRRCEYRWLRDYYKQKKRVE